ACGVCVPCFCGGYSGGETPGPIPNPEAKPACADGTALDRVWESKTPPQYFSQEEPEGLSVARLRAFLIHTRDATSTRPPSHPRRHPTQANLCPDWCC